MKYKKHKYILLIAVAFLLQSCFVAKDYNRPQIETENLYRSEVATADSLSLADIAWTKLFTDPILQRHIQEGLAHNIDIQIALQNIVAAEATMKQGRAGFMPTLDLGADWTHQELSKNTQFGNLLSDRNSDQYQLAGTLSWEADIWGKIRSAKRATNAEYFRTIAASQAVKTHLIADIAATYFELLSTDAQLKLSRETLENRSKSIETIIALKDAGNVTEVGVKQTEAQKFSTEIIIADLDNRISVLENAMRFLLGKSPGPIERSTLDSQVLDANILTGVPANLLRNRPDVIAAEYALISNFEQVNVARSNFYPTFRITAAGGFQSIDLKEWFSANSLFANIVTGLTQPILNQRRIRTQHEIAKSNQQIAYLQFESSLLNAGREVSDALAQYQNETYKIGIRTRQVDALLKAAAYSDELLTYGLANYLEVLTAKDDALNTQLDLIDNRYKQLNATIQLYRALGGGWK